MRRLFRESFTWKPSPLVTPSISAATITTQAIPSASRNPVRIWGNAAGRMTRRNRPKPRTPKFCADRRYFDSIERTAEVVAVTIGKTLARKIRKIDEASAASQIVRPQTVKRTPPNKTTAKGIQAIGEIGRSI